MDILTEMLKFDYLRSSSVWGSGKHPDNCGFLSESGTHEHRNLELQEKGTFVGPTMQAEIIYFYPTIYSPAGIQPGKFEDSKQFSSRSRAASHRDLKVAVSWSA